MTTTSRERTTRHPQFAMHHRLALALEAAGMKTSDMARQLGVHENTVRNYLKGRHIPRPALIAWAALCSVPLDWLEGEESPSDLRNSGTGWLLPFAA